MNKNAFYVLFLLVIVFVNCSGRIERLLDDFVELENLKAATGGVSPVGKPSVKAHVGAGVHAKHTKPAGKGKKQRKGKGKSKAKGKGKGAKRPNLQSVRPVIATKPFRPAVLPVAGSQVSNGVLLAQIRNAWDNQKKANTEFHRTLTTHCTAAHAKIQGSITKLTQAITDAQNNMNTHKQSLEKSNKAVKEAAENIQKARTAYKGLNQRLDKTLLDYKVVAQEADQKLNVVKLLRDIISDELLNDKPGNFVQLNKFQEKLNELKGMLNNNNDSIYAPIVSVLLDLATEQNFANQGVLKQILQNLNNLDKALREFRKKQEAGLDSEVKSIRAQMKNTVDRIQAYSRMRAQSRSKSLDSTHYIRFYSHEIEHFNAEKGRKGEEQKMLTKLCDYHHKTRKGVERRAKNFWDRVQKRLPSSFMALEKP
jgi:chromosome segregation ATPase